MLPQRTFAALAAIAGLFALSACNSTTPQATAPQVAVPAASYANNAPGVTPAGFRLPEGTGCQGDVARWAAIQDNDLRTGHVSKSVHDTIQKEIAAARQTCDAGNSAQASSMVRASRARHGYPASQGPTG